MQAVWGPDYGDQVDYLRVFIRNLRKKIERNPERPQYITTEPWVGYRFNDGARRLVSPATLVRPLYEKGVCARNKRCEMQCPIFTNSSCLFHDFFSRLPPNLETGRCPMGARTDMALALEKCMTLETGLPGCARRRRPPEAGIPPIRK